MNIAKKIPARNLSRQQESCAQIQAAGAEQLKGFAARALSIISGTRSPKVLEGFARSVWQDWSAGHLSDAEAQELAERIEQRRTILRGTDTLAARAPNVSEAAKAAGKPSFFPPKRKAAVSKDRAASMRRRRLLAASGPMPPSLACQFTTGELAVLRVVADCVRDRGACCMSIGEIAARAGVCLSLARNALRLAARLGLLTIEERRRNRQPNLTNIVRIIAREWLNWMVRGKTKAVSAVWAAPPKNTKKVSSADLEFSAMGGCKKHESTDKSHILPRNLT